ncbi:MAG: VanZ family protein [Granulosicoccus sp.]
MDYSQLKEELLWSRDTRPRSFVLFCIFLLMTTLLTWAIGLLDNRYIALEHEGFGEVFPAQIDSWTRVGESSMTRSAVTTIDVYPETGTDSGATFVMALPDSLGADYNLIRVRSIVYTMARPSNPDLKTDAGVLLRLLDRNDDIFQHSWVSRLTGDFDTHRDEYLTVIDPKTESIKIRFSNRKSDGSFSLEKVDVDIVKISPFYRFFFLPALVLMWAALLLVSAIYVIRKSGRRKTLMLVGVVSFMILGILLPNSLRDSIVHPVFDQLKALGLAGNSVALVHYYKAGHFLVFFLISLILFYTAKQLRISKTDLFGVLCVVAIATEGAQLHLFFRSTQPIDIFIDTAGIALALLVYHATHKKFGSREKKSSRRKKRRRSKQKAVE